MIGFLASKGARGRLKDAWPIIDVFNNLDKNQNYKSITKKIKKVNKQH